MFSRKGKSAAFSVGVSFSGCGLVIVSLETVRWSYGFATFGLLFLACLYHHNQQVFSSKQPRAQNCEMLARFDTDLQ